MSKLYIKRTHESEYEEIGDVVAIKVDTDDDEELEVTHTYESNLEDLDLTDQKIM